MRKQKASQNKFHTAGIFSIIAACFVIPLSTSLTGITTALACVFWILSGKAVTLPRLALSNHLVFLSLLLFLIFIAGLSYTPVPLDEAFSILKKYRELLLFPIVISLTMENDDACRFAENSFFLGCVFLLMISYGMFFSIIPLYKYGFSLVYHITHSFFMAILAFWCLQRMLDSKQYIYLWLVLFIVTTINLFYIAPGRTGMFVYVILMILAFFQRFSLKKAISATLLVTTLIALTFATSQNFSTRVLEAVNEMKTYQSTSESSRTSLGMRFDWWQNSVELIKQKPILGHGTGSFAAAQEKLIKDTKTKPTDNPHNEYLLIGVQVGIPALVVFIAILAAQLIYSLRLHHPRKYLLQGVVISMACGCLMNSFLFDSLPGHYFAIISALLISPARRKADISVIYKK